MALATGCYHYDRVTGVFGLNSGPLDHRYYEAFQEFTGYIEKLRSLDLNLSSKEIDIFLK